MPSSSLKFPYRKISSERTRWVWMGSEPVCNIIQPHCKGERASDGASYMAFGRDAVRERTGLKCFKRAFIRMTHHSNVDDSRSYRPIHAEEGKIGHPLVGLSWNWCTNINILWRAVRQIVYTYNHD